MNFLWFLLVCRSLYKQEVVKSSMNSKLVLVIRLTLAWKLLHRKF